MLTSFPSFPTEAERHHTTMPEFLIFTTFKQLYRVGPCYSQWYSTHYYFNQQYSNHSQLRILQIHINWFYIEYTMRLSCFAGLGTESWRCHFTKSQKEPAFELPLQLYGSCCCAQKGASFLCNQNRRVKISAMLLQKTHHGCPTNTKKSRPWTNTSLLNITVTGSQKISDSFPVSVTFLLSQGFRHRLLPVHQGGQTNSEKLSSTKTAGNQAQGWFNGFCLYQKLQTVLRRHTWNSKS